MKRLQQNPLSSVRFSNGSTELLKAVVSSLLVILACIVSIQPPAAHAQSDIDLTGYTLTFSDEFDTLSATTTSPKGSSKWYCGYPPNGPGGIYGNARRDITCLSVNNGILENKLKLETAVDASGAYCGGPVGMKNSAGTAMVNVVTLGTQVRDHATWQWYGWAGMKFTVGASPLTISQLGRYAISTNTQTHQIRIFDATTGADVAKTIVDCAGQTGFVYGNIIGGNVTLSANTSYYLLTDNYSNQDYLYAGTDTTITATAGITINESRSGGWRAGTMYSADSTAAGFSQQYGYFEMKAKLPSSGKGAFPSFWLKTLNDITKVGNKIEEIDIMEWYGARYSDTPQRNTVQQVSHNWDGGGQESDPPTHLYNPDVQIPSGAFPWAGFHIYGFKSDPVNCTWYIDGVQTAQIPTPTDYLANPMYVLTNYSLGGAALDGVVSNSKLEIDWIRVYSLPPNSGPAFTNGSFETPATANYIWRPTGAGWTFTNYSGVQHNGGVYGAANAPDGVQTALLQGYASTLGTMTQTVNFPSGGSYYLTFQAARRSTQVQPIRLKVDGVTVGTYTPASSSFALITTAAFSVAAGNHAILFEATDNVGDKTTFLDQLNIVPVPPPPGNPTFANASFESPAIATYVWTPANASWTFTNYAGLQHNGSVYYASDAPDGVQTALLQGYASTLGTMTQSVSFSTAGSYAMRFQAARRYGTPQPIRASMDGATIGTYTPLSNSFELITTDSFTATAGNHSIQFAATDNSGDKTTFLDQMTIVGSMAISATGAGSNQLGASTANDRLHQSFVAPSAAIYGVNVGLSKVGVPISNITVSIRSTRTGADLASGTITPSQVTSVSAGSPTLVNVNFATPLAVTYGDTYYLTLTVATTNASNYYGWTVNSANPYSNGQCWLLDTAQSANDAVAKIYH